MFRRCRAMRIRASLLVLVTVASLTLVSVGHGAALESDPTKQYDSQAECEQATGKSCTQLLNGKWRMVATIEGEKGGTRDREDWSLEELLQYGKVMPINTSGTLENPVVTVDLERVAFPDVQPYLDSSVGRVRVPIRFVSEKMGASVSWDGDTQTVTIARDELLIQLQVDNPIATVNGKGLAIDAPPVLIPPGRVMVPIRFISEAFGATVDWVGGEAPPYRTDYLGRYQVWIFIPWGFFGKTGLEARLTQGDFLVRN